MAGPVLRRRTVPAIVAAWQRRHFDQFRVNPELGERMADATAEPTDTTPETAAPAEDPETEDPAAITEPETAETAENPAARPKRPSAFWAVSVLAVACSLLFGAIGLYYSAQVGPRWADGDAAGARRASRAALALDLIGILGAIVIVTLLVAINRR